MESSESPQRGRHLLWSVQAIVEPSRGVSEGPAAAHEPRTLRFIAASPALPAPTRMQPLNQPNELLFRGLSLSP